MKFKNFFTKRKIMFISITAVLIAALGISAFAVADNLRNRDSKPLFDEKQIDDNGETNDEKTDGQVIDIVKEKAKNTEDNKTVGNVNAHQNTSNPALSESDISLKNSISAVSDTKIDFRINREVGLFGKNYATSFYKLGDSESNTQNSIIYKDNSGNEFRFDLTTGKLKAFYLPTETVFEKSNNSISSSQAEEIAKNYYNANYNGYTLSESKEESGGYTYYFNKYYSGYKTDDSVIVRVGFDGKINRLISSASNYDNTDIKINEAKVAAEKQKIIDQYNNVEIQECRLKNNNGKLYMEIQYKYTAENGFSAVAVGMASIEAVKD